MRRDEVEWHTSLGSVRSQRLNPFAGRGRRTADAQAVINTLDRARRFVVEAQVLVLTARPEHDEIRLVPHLERPGLDLVDAVTIDEVRSQRPHDVVPLGPIAGWRDDALVTEHGLGRIARDGSGHERQLDDWSR